MWPTALLVSCVAAAAGSVRAQGTVVPRPEPKAGTILHVTATQELLIAPAAGSPASAEIRAHSVLGFMQTNGAFNDQGRMEAKLTIERLESRQVINGTVKRTRDLTPLIGKTLTAVVDRSGELLDVTLSSELQPMAATIKQLVATAFGVIKLVPKEALAVGGQATVESDIPLRLPAAGDTPLRARSLVTLRSVDGGRARLDQRVTAVEGSPVTLTGTGTIDVNLTRGYVAASTSEWSVESATSAAGAAAQTAPGVRAIVKVTLTATE